MQVKSHTSPPCSDTFSSYSFLRDNTNIHDQELIPPTYRLSRLPFNLLDLVNTIGVAISASYSISTQLGRYEEALQIVAIVRTTREQLIHVVRFTALAVKQSC
jgi:hypothetical protein